MRSLVALVLLTAACAAPPANASPSPTATEVPLATASLGGLARGVTAEVRSPRRWHLVPDGLQQEPATITADFAVDPRPGEPRVRVAGRDAPMSTAPGASRGFTTTGLVPLSGLAPGEYRADVVVRLADGGETVVGSTTFVVSQPEYVVWTLDFEGDDASDATMANTAAIADGLAVPMTVMWNPRVWTTSQVSAARADAMLAWTRGRATKGDEIALHLHMWTDYVRAAGVTPRTTPNWGGRGDGYDVPMTAFSEGETKTLVEYGLRLMAERGLPRPTSFRAGALFGNAATLRAIADLGFTADCTAAPAGPFGSLQLPWTLARDAQPYYPSREDANRTGDLPLLEAPTNAGNTFGHSPASINGVIDGDLRMLASQGQPATERRGLTIVSHPSTIDGTERAAIEALFRAFGPLRYDRDAGPVRFVTLAQLAKAFAR
jgi:hypothetical protein